MKGIERGMKTTSTSGKHALYNPLDDIIQTRQSDGRRKMRGRTRRRPLQDELEKDE